MFEGLLADAESLPDRRGRTVVVESQLPVVAFERLDNLIRKRGRIRFVRPADRLVPQAAVGSGASAEAVALRLTLLALRNRITRFHLKFSGLNLRAALLFNVLVSFVIAVVGCQGLKAAESKF